MRKLSLLCLLLPLSLAWGQTEPNEPPAGSATTVDRNAKDSAKDKDDKQPLPDSAATVPPDAAVLTIKGLCPGQEKTASAASACQTIITKAQFEELTEALHPNMPPTTKRQLASSYPRLMAMAHEAEQRGLDKKEHFQEMIAFARLQILSQDLVHEIEDEASQISQKDVEDYYRENAANFERVNVERITVPNIRQVSQSAGASGNKENSEEQDKAAMKGEADSLRARAAAGEDFATLQKAAYEFAGLSTPPPATSLSMIRRTTLPAGHASVFDLKAGEVSPVISDDGGFYIYKALSKQDEPPNEAEKEIRKTLVSQRIHATMQKVQDSITTEMNQAYFGPPSKHHAASQTKANPAGAASTAADNPK
jgi:PPIC-type PPIASE domain